MMCAYIIIMMRFDFLGVFSYYGPTIKLSMVIVDWQRNKTKTIASTII